MTDFSSSYALLESKCSTPHLHSITQRVSQTRLVPQLVFASSDNHTCLALPLEQVFRQFVPNSCAPSCMCPLMKHFTASAKSTLFCATYANITTVQRYEVDSVGVSLSELSICTVGFSILLTRRNDARPHQPIPCSSTQQAWSNVLVYSPQPSPFLSQISASASVVLPRRSRRRGSILGDLRLDWKRTRSTQFKPSWNHPPELLTMCLHRLTLHIASLTCTSIVWPVCLSIRTLQESTCRSTCEHGSTNAPLTHPTLPSRSVHPCDFHCLVP